MPEGDTIYRTAAQLRQVVDGQLIRATGGRTRLPEVSQLVGARIVATHARGKHLLLNLDSGQTIHSHLGMTGSWHSYAPAQPWLKPARLAELVLELPNAAVVCFSPKTLEILSATALRRHPHLTQLGPDLLEPDFDSDAALCRFRSYAATAIGEAVMNQTIVCGIGNVYKSELLFLERVNPFCQVGQLSDTQLGQLIHHARSLLRRNLGGQPRRTRFGRDGHRVWVYGRSGQACFVCGTRIRMQHQGDLGRSTYWCPECQK
jgi:endonuclease-8